MKLATLLIAASLFCRDAVSTVVKTIYGTILMLINYDFSLTNILLVQALLVSQYMLGFNWYIFATILPVLVLLFRMKTQYSNTTKDMETIKAKLLVLTDKFNKLNYHFIQLNNLVPGSLDYSYSDIIEERSTIQQYNNSQCSGQYRNDKPKQNLSDSLLQNNPIDLCPFDDIRNELKNIAYDTLIEESKTPVQIYHDPRFPKYQHDTKQKQGLSDSNLMDLYPLNEIENIDYDEEIEALYSRS